MGWQKLSAYKCRSVIEAVIGCFTRVIGDVLRSTTERHRPTTNEMTFTTSVCRSIEHSPERRQGLSFTEACANKPSGRSEHAAWHALDAIVAAVARRGAQEERWV
jgi:hypothetical protein